MRRLVGSDGGIAGLFALFCLLLTLTAWGGPFNGGPDALYYEAQKGEVQGEDQKAARERVFASPLKDIVARENPVVRDGEWVDYSERFYRRRWTVPAAAAALDPIAGVSSLEAVSLLAYTALGPLLFLLLRRRFEPLVSAAGAGLCVVLPPVLDHTRVPGTDGLGLTLLVAAFLMAILVRERGPRWLPAFFGVVLALSFTRDATIVVLLAAGWLAMRERSRRAAYVLGAGVLASLPAPLLFKAPLRENLAYVLSDFDIPRDTSWSFIAGEYPGALAHVVRYNFQYPLETWFPPLTLLMGVVVIAGLVLLFFASPRNDAFLRLHRASAIGGAVIVLISVNYTSLRLELAFIPSVAVGFALLAQRALKMYRERRSATSPGCA